VIKESAKDSKPSCPPRVVPPGGAPPQLMVQAISTGFRCPPRISSSAIWRERASIISKRRAVERKRWYASSKSSSPSSDDASGDTFR